jgi:hypothetical protein
MAISGCPTSFSMWNCMVYCGLTHKHILPASTNGRGVCNDALLSRTNEKVRRFRYRSLKLRLSTARTKSSPIRARTSAEKYTWDDSCSRHNTAMVSQTGADAGTHIIPNVYTPVHSPSLCSEHACAHKRMPTRDAGMPWWKPIPFFLPGKSILGGH